jgi:ectoine hydroxylase-related dioxygenase (phytanoyl-CoA dioxygenase family)
LPTPTEAPAATTSWHRDFAGLHFGTAVPGYLWFFVCLDDVTCDNGATWVVPGSHRIPSPHEPAPSPTWSSDDFEQYPSRLQLCARAGDLLVLSPSLLHTSGRNRTSKPRRLLNVGICHADLQPLLDHWAIAGPAIQKRAGDRMKKMLGADRKPLDATWSVLPEGWQTAGR